MTLQSCSSAANLQGKGGSVLQALKEALDTAVALGLAHESGRAFDAEES
jgi:hypothetical protein